MEQVFKSKKCNGNVQWEEEEEGILGWGLNGIEWERNEGRGGEGGDGEEG
jgi:hypothetical protein